jgi:Flp pilus assembly protein TadD
MLGAMHPEALEAKMNLASLLQNHGESDEARRLYVEVVDGYSLSLGAQDMDTLTAKMNLASLLGTLGESDEARRLYAEVAEVVDGYTSMLGAKHTKRLRRR